MLIAVNFHYIRPSFDAPYAGIHGLTPSQFASQLETLGALGTFVSGACIKEAVAGRQTLPARAIAITIDDGLREQYEYAWPVLTRLGVPAIFYVNTAPLIEHRVATVHKIHLLRSEVAPAAFMAMLQRHADTSGINLARDVDDRRALLQYEYDPPEIARLKFLLNLTLTTAERDALVDYCFAEHFGDERAISRQLYMDVDQVRTLSRDVAIGIHSHEHVPLGLMPTASAAAQLRTCIEHLVAWTGHRPYTLSYPFGEHEACSAEVAAEARVLGIAFAFTMERAANVDLEFPLHLARFDSNDAPGGKHPYWRGSEFFALAPCATWYRPSPVRAS